MVYKKATLEDLDLLVSTRLTVLRAANHLDETVELAEVEKCTREYYSHALTDDSQLTILVLDGKKVIGAGSICYFKVMPTYHNPSGVKAYIMNMYTDPSYRRQGVATRTLNMLVDDAKSKGISTIFLEATEMGRPVYEKYGFVQMVHEMELPAYVV